MLSIRNKSIVVYTATLKVVGTLYSGCQAVVLSSLLAGCPAFRELVSGVMMHSGPSSPFLPSGMCVAFAQLLTWANVWLLALTVQHFVRVRVWVRWFIQLRRLTRLQLSNKNGQLNGKWLCCYCLLRKTATSWLSPSPSALCWNINQSCYAMLRDVRCR